MLLLVVETQGDDRRHARQVRLVGALQQIQNVFVDVRAIAIRFLHRGTRDVPALGPRVASPIRGREGR